MATLIACVVPLLLSVLNVSSSYLYGINGHFSRQKKEKSEKLEEKHTEKDSWNPRAQLNCNEECPFFACYRVDDSDVDQTIESRNTASPIPAVQVIEGLDDDLWNELPEDIMVSVLARLPLRDLARYRTTCRKWQAMCYSPSFIQLRAQSFTEKSWFIFNRQERVGFLDTQDTRYQRPDSHCLAYNLGVNRWHTLPFNNLPFVVDRVAATAGGLMFCVTKPSLSKMGAVVSWSWPLMIVCNPLKENCYTQLPGRHSSWKPHTIGMVVDSNTDSFKIVLAALHRGTEIYDSRLKSWKLLEFCSPPAKSVRSEAVSHKGFIYSVGVNLMLAFDVGKESWSLFDLPHPEREIQNTQLYECDGRLLLVGCMKSKYTREKARMLVWELVSGLWKELSSVSVRAVNTAIFSEMENCRGQNDLLFVRGVDHVDLQEQPRGRYHQRVAGSGNLKEVTPEHACLYSLSHNKWYFLDESPIYSQGLTEYQREALRFEPKIEASVSMHSQGLWM